jgi:hypothetical protein
MILRIFLTDPEFNGLVMMASYERQCVFSLSSSKPVTNQPAYDILLHLGGELGIRSLRSIDRWDRAVTNETPLVRLLRLYLLPVPVVSLVVHGELRIVVSFRFEIVFTGYGGCLWEAPGDGKLRPGTLPAMVRGNRKGKRSSTSGWRSASFALDACKRYRRWCNVRVDSQLRL